jgi:hypothetical protein
MEIMHLTGGGGTVLLDYSDFAPFLLIQSEMDTPLLSDDFDNRGNVPLVWLLALDSETGDLDAL